MSSSISADSVAAAASLRIFFSRRAALPRVDERRGVTAARAVLWRLDGMARYRHFDIRFDLYGVKAALEAENSDSTLTGELEEVHSRRRSPSFTGRLVLFR